jgi:septum formation protein
MAQDRERIGQPGQRLILASGSPRRASLMREHGYDVEVVAPPFAEPSESVRALAPAQQAEALSYFKARSVAPLVGRGWVLAGDTIVSLGGRIFGKPVDRADARNILSALSGTTHEVITGVTLLDAATAKRAVRHAVTAITFKPITAAQVEVYLDTRSWVGKAGAYGIQDRGDAFVERIDGSFTNVVGLPMDLVRQMLGQWGLRGGPASELCVGS